MLMAYWLAGILMLIFKHRIVLTVSVKPNLCLSFGLLRRKVLRSPCTNEQDISSILMIRLFKQAASITSLPRRNKKNSWYVTGMSEKSQFDCLYIAFYSRGRPRRRERGSWRHE